MHDGNWFLYLVFLDSMVDYFTSNLRQHFKNGFVVTGVLDFIIQGKHRDSGNNELTPV